MCFVSREIKAKLLNKKPITFACLIYCPNFRSIVTLSYIKERRICMGYLPKVVFQPSNPFFTSTLPVGKFRDLKYKWTDLQSSFVSLYYDCLDNEGVCLSHWSHMTLLPARPISSNGNSRSRNNIFNFWHVNWLCFFKCYMLYMESVYKLII